MDSSDEPAAWPATGLEAVRRCPVCGNAERTEFYRDLHDYVFCCAPGAWTLYRCSGCGAAYLDPRPTVSTIELAYRSYYTHHQLANQCLSTRPWSRQAIKNGYLNRYFGYNFQPSLVAAARALYFFPLHRRRCERSIRGLAQRPGGHLLDVGCGNGAFLEMMRAQGWEAHGVDLDARVVDACRAKGLTVHLGTVNDLDYPDGFFDAITLNHVIEHVYDPVGALRRSRELLGFGGRLWVETPNLEGASHRVFRRHWRGLEPPRHLVLFGRKALRRACELAGWPDVRITGAPGAVGITAASRLVRRRAVRGAGVIAAQRLADRPTDGLFDIAGFLNPTLAENLVATAELGRPISPS